MLPIDKDTSRFECPITCEFYTDPVSVDCGSRLPHIFERLAIVDWMKRESICPLDRGKITTLTGQPALKIEVEEYLKQKVQVADPETDQKITSLPQANEGCSSFPQKPSFDPSEFLKIYRNRAEFYGMNRTHPQNFLATCLEEMRSPFVLVPAEKDIEDPFYPSSPAFFVNNWGWTWNQHSGLKQIRFFNVECLSHSILIAFELGVDRRRDTPLWPGFNLLPELVDKPPAPVSISLYFKKNDCNNGFFKDYLQARGLVCHEVERGAFDLCDQTCCTSRTHEELKALFQIIRRHNIIDFREAGSKLDEGKICEIIEQGY